MKAEFLIILVFMSDAYKILLVEDQALLAEDLLHRLHHLGYGSVLGPFDSAEDALDQEADIAVLDINLKGKMSGVELAALLNQDRNVPVVFLTHLQDDATFDSAYETEPVAFLNKPFTNSELRMAMASAVKALKAEKPNREPQSPIQVLDDRIFVRNGRGKLHIILEKVLWIQSGGGETSAITTEETLNKTGKLPHTVGLNLNKLEEKLAFCPYLIRCSRFHIINLRHVERILDDTGKSKNRKILVIKGQEISVGDKYRKDVMSKLHIL